GYTLFLQPPCGCARQPRRISSCQIVVLSWAVSSEWGVGLNLTRRKSSAPCADSFAMIPLSLMTVGLGREAAGHRAPIGSRCLLILWSLRDGVIRPSLRGCREHGPAGRDRFDSDLTPAPVIDQLLEDVAEVV